MEIWEAVLLGIVQGLTEWLPISSSGHLAVFQSKLGKVPLVFDIFLHIGTLLVVLIYFRRDVTDVISCLKDFLINKDKRNEIKKRWGWNVLVYGTVALVPTAAIGYAVDIFAINTFYENTWWVSIFLIINSAILFSSLYTQEKRKLEHLNLKDGLIIGIMQGFSVIPGISRSGATIVSGMHLKIMREDAARFSFLIMVPAVIGAMLLHAGDLPGEDYTNIQPYLIGTVVSFVVGYISLYLLMYVVKKGKLHHFGIYCVIAALIIFFV